MSSVQQYLDLYREQRALIEQNSSAPLNARRAEAAKCLSHLPLPTRRVERYKYTDAEAAFSPDFGLNLHRYALPGEQMLPSCRVPALHTFLMHVNNDVVCPLADDVVLPEGVTIMSLNEATLHHPDLVARYYHQAATQEPANAHKHTDRIKRDAVTMLNTLLVQDGIFVHVAPGVKCDRTLQVVFRASADTDFMSNRRVLVVAEEDSQIDLLFCEHAEGTHRYLSTQVTEIFTAPRAEVNLYTLEETHAHNTRFSNIYVEQEADSRISINAIALLTGVSRTMVNARLLGRGAHCQTTGAVIADSHQRVDNSILIDHVAEACTSDMLYKYVLDGESEAAFAGKVLVRPGAQQTLSQQTSANICISPTAKVHSQPMLEIYADDVKCNHGSTVGKLDEGALLYLRQRGIPEKEARLLLQHAFINDVLQRVHLDPLRERLSYLVEQRFRGELCHCQSSCQGCSSAQ